MILESAVLDVKPGQADAFEAAFAKPQRIIAASPGYLGHELKRCIEQPNRYLLLVRWRTLEDHTEGFRKSAPYQEWRKLLHHFYDPFPTVEHYEAVGSSDRPALDQVNIVARDVDATLAFYRRFGAAFRDAPESHGIRHAGAEMGNGVSLEVDNETLARIYSSAWRRGESSSRALIGFSLASREAVDSLYGELVGAGYAGRQKPHDAFWGARYAVVADPDGNDVGLMSPIDPGRRRWPPQEAPE